MRRLLFALLCAGCGLAGGARPASAAKHAYLQELNRLQAKSERSPEDWNRAGRFHREVALLYHYLALNLSESTVLAMVYYGDTVTHGWGGEYFSCLSQVVAHHDTAGVYCERVRDLENIPPLLKSLSLVLAGVADRQQDAAGWKSWSDLGADAGLPAAEAYSQWARLNGCRTPTAAPPGADSRQGTVDATPLLQRARLEALICRGEPDLLAQMVSEIEADPAYWSVDFDSGRVERYGDPALVSALSRAHFRLAAHAFSKGAEAGLSDRSQYESRLEYLSVAMHLDDRPRALELARDYEDSSAVRAFRGWSEWSSGDLEAARKSWKRCIESGDPRSQGELLQVWSHLGGFESSGDSLARAMREALGEGKELARLISGGGGSQGWYRAWYTLRNVAVWHLAQHRYDTASTYFGMVMIMPELSLDQYQPSFCGEYLSARSMTDRGADLNESWSRWSHIGEYYPVARYILMPIHVRAFGGWSDSEGTN